MSEKSEQFNSQEMQSALALLVWKNEKLRDEILKNPKQVIERELNVKFDENIKIKVVNQTEANEVVFVLPYSINKVAGQELSDDQLEEVAGGFSFGSAVKGLVKEHGANVGGYIGDGIGTGVQLGGKAAFGIDLPDTGLGRQIGSAAGKALADNM